MKKNSKIILPQHRTASLAIQIHHRK